MEDQEPSRVETIVKVCVLLWSATLLSLSYYEPPSGKKIVDFDLYEEKLKQRLDPSVTIMQGINNKIKKNPKRVVFADGEDENTLKAAIAFKNSGLGTPIILSLIHI